MEYEFLFVVEVVSIDDDDAASTLAAEFEALLSWHRGRHLLAVAAEGTDVMDALNRLLPQLADALPDLRLIRLDPDLVGVAEIAERAVRSRQTVQQWVDGDRPGGTPFPAPEGTVGRCLAWRWAEVNAWLRHIGLDDGDLRPDRQEALSVDLALFQWPQRRQVAAGRVGEPYGAGR